MSQRRGPRQDMVPEIAAAVGFVSGLLRTRGCVSEQQLQVFSGALREALAGEGQRSGFAKGRGGRWCPLELPGLLPASGVPPWVPVSVLWCRAPVCAALVAFVPLGAHPCPSGHL